MSAEAPAGLRVRPARTSDVPAIRRLVDLYAPDRRLLSKATVTLYEDIQEFVVAEVDGYEIGVGALHVMWEDLAEIRTLAVDPGFVGRGVGGRVLRLLLDRAEMLGVGRVFCLTFETGFFERHGFERYQGEVVPPEVFAELLRSEDEGVAEFLDLERVKPNTLGNERMIRRLSSASRANIGAV
ncbi:MAG: amino-acid N-acetyltransferase [Candidatus Nanopelagicales bacterium]|nr:amino-acid N-acetyltransferase [Candidatus Nanopelagicales bacterium]